MPSIGLNVEKFQAELEAAGLDEVRVRLATKVYNVDVGEKGALAKEWLLRKELELAKEAERNSNEIAAEQTRIARSAKNAAWLSGIVSIVALVISTGALVVSLSGE